jgi:ubiquinone/menaquinone biosynthesis C-methylase UbiE
MMKDNLTWENAVLWLRAQPEQQELVRACYYDDPLLEAAMRFEASEEWQAVREMLPRKTGISLDLGAGRGISSYALAKAGWQVDALEPDASAVVGRGAIERLAGESALPIHTLAGFAEKIPAQNGMYDLVYGRQVMHHAHNLQTMCNEIFRVLKPGGTFIATREHVISKKEDLPIFLDNHALHHLYGGENAYLLKEYLGALTSAGLQVSRALGPMTTVINYFPATRENWLYMIQPSFTRWVDHRITSILFSDRLPWSNFITYYLSNRTDRKDQTPGRLYSFVAVKKSL